MIVFTNGCFDLIHPGHIDLLTRARSLGDKLIVGINSDESVRSIKGEGRPIQPAEARRDVLLGLKAVDEVRIFNELTPEALIREIKPDVLVKGGDWRPNEIVGAGFVESYGGRVVSLPLVEGHSTTKMVDKMGSNQPTEAQPESSGIVGDTLDQHIRVVQELRAGYIASIESTAEMIVETFAAGKKILICGNGGSAADAQHLAAEFVGRYEKERKALPAIALTTDTSALTALANDYDFERIFARQVDALAVKGDLLIAISTSGNSPNVIAAVMSARERGCRTIAMTGSKGKKLAGLCDGAILAPSDRTARIQECHITVAHIWCDIVEGSRAVQ